jgi:glycosyltransferase involved in cell wall biosynthesis
MEKINPLVSIIVPNYNHEKFLVQRLDTVFNQTYPNYEVILLDDCSTDNSREILSRYANNSKVSHCVFNEVNSGNTFIQWNKGINLAKGDYIWIAESDDFCELNFLEEVIKPLLTDKDIVLSYCQSFRVNENNEVSGSWLDHTDEFDSEIFKANFRVEGNVFVEKFLIYKNVIPNASGVVFRKNKAIEIQGLDTSLSLKYVGDWVFYLHLILNERLHFTHHCFNYFRYHSQSVIATSLRSRKVTDTFDILLVTRKKIKEILTKMAPANCNELCQLNENEKRKTFTAKINYYKKNYTAVIVKIIKTIFFLKNK